MTKDHNRNFKEKLIKLLAKMNIFTIKLEAKHNISTIRIIDKVMYISFLLYKLFSKHSFHVSIFPLPILVQLWIVLSTSHKIFYNSSRYIYPKNSNSKKLFVCIVCTDKYNDITWVNLFLISTYHCHISTSMSLIYILCIFLARKKYLQKLKSH